MSKSLRKNDIGTIIAKKLDLLSPSETFLPIFYPQWIEKNWGTIHSNRSPSLVSDRNLAKVFEIQVLVNSFKAQKVF